jgi:hypothetical protein
MGKFSEMDIDIQECVEDLKKLRGIAPHNHPSNLVYGDGYFAKSLDSKYTAQVRTEAEKRLEADSERLTLRVTPEQQELMTDLIIEERTAMSASRKYVVDADLEEWDQRYDDLGALLEEVTGHSPD